jgi:hypothetical protein
VARAHLAAHGVGVRGLFGWLLAWAVVLLASRASISALGFQFGPPGSAPLDTAAVVLLVLPAAVLARCARTRTPELEQTRSRPRQPYELLWALGLGGVAVLAPLAFAGLLHPAIDTRVFVADWYLTVGLCLLLGALTRSRIGAAGAFAVLAAFSVPGLVPWEANVVYNLDLAGISLPLGMAVLTTGALLCAARHHTTE